MVEWSEADFIEDEEIVSAELFDGFADGVVSGGAVEVFDEVYCGEVADNFILIRVHTISRLMPITARSPTLEFEARHALDHPPLVRSTATRGGLARPWPDVASAAADPLP